MDRCFAGECLICIASAIFGGQTSTLKLCAHCISISQLSLIGKIYIIYNDFVCPVLEIVVTFTALA